MSSPSCRVEYIYWINMPVFLPINRWDDYSRDFTTYSSPRPLVGNALIFRLDSESIHPGNWDFESAALASLRAKPRLVILETSVNTFWCFSSLLRVANIHQKYTIGHQGCIPGKCSRISEKEGLQIRIVTIFNTLRKTFVAQMAALFSPSRPAPQTCATRCKISSPDIMGAWTVDAPSV